MRLGPDASAHVGAMGAMSPRQRTDASIDDDGWTRTRLVFDDVRAAAAALLALSPEVEVEDPPELRERMADLATQQLRRLVGAAQGA